jgi:hypothetical protein
MLSRLLLLTSARLGPQLATGQTYAPFSANVVGGANSAAFTAAGPGDGASYNHELTLGRFYEITYEVSGYAGGGLYVATGGGGSDLPSRTANGIYTDQKQALGNSILYIVANTPGTTATVTIRSLRLMRRNPVV